MKIHTKLFNSSITVTNTHLVVGLKLRKELDSVKSLRGIDNESNSLQKLIL